MGQSYSRKYLSAQLTEQIARLAEKQAPRPVPYILANQRKDVLRKAVSLKVEKDEAAFLPIIPFTYRSYFDQMPMIVIDGKRGQNRTCDNGCIWRGTAYTHQYPWYIFKVSISSPLSGKSIREYLRELQDAGRRPLLTEEVIALCLHKQPKNMSLLCHVPHSNSWSQSHLLTGKVEGDELFNKADECGPSVFGLAGDLDSPRRQLRIPSCLL